MAAGPLRESVTFQRRQVASDGAGNQRTSWADLAGAVALPARLKPLRQAEVVLDEGVQGRAAYEVQVRWTEAAAGINVGDRMIDARAPTRTFAVKGPPLNVDEHRRFLRIPVEQGGADG